MVSELASRPYEGTSAPSPNITPPLTFIPTGLTVEHRASELRNRAAVLASETEATHRNATGYALLKSTQSYLRLAPSDLLRMLSTDFGFSWTEIASTVGVSVQALRKWRFGGAPTADNRLSLASLTAFANHLDHLGVAEPAAWAALPILPGYAPTGMDVYRAHRGDLVCGLARGQVSPEQVLSAYDPTWRIAQRLEHEVFEASDGELATRRRP